MCGVDQVLSSSTVFVEQGAITCQSEGVWSSKFLLLATDLSWATPWWSGSVKMLRGSGWIYSSHWCSWPQSPSVSLWSIFLCDHDGQLFCLLWTHSWWLSWPPFWLSPVVVSPRWLQQDNTQTNHLLILKNLSPFRSIVSLNLFVERKLKLYLSCIIALPNLQVSMFWRQFFVRFRYGLVGESQISYG